MLTPYWQGELSDYVTAIAWSPVGDALVATSAAGEVMLYDRATGQSQLLQAANGQSHDCLAWSHDGQFLAVGGQAGCVQVWAWTTATPEHLARIEATTTWIDRLAWSPTQNLLTYGAGKTVKVWDADRQEVVTSLNFTHSAPFAITWHPDGQQLAVGGYQGVKIWTAQHWDDAPYVLTIPSASVAIAWSSDGQYLAVGNLDQTITVLDWQPSQDIPETASRPLTDSTPWIMRGFPGKIRQLAWSARENRGQSPLLASASADSLIIWAKHTDAAIGWEGQVAGNHRGTIQAIGFQPGTTLLASAGADGWLGLWYDGTELVQTMAGAHQGFSCLSWHPQGHSLAAGGQQGEVLLWS